MSVAPVSLNHAASPLSATVGAGRQADFAGALAAAASAGGKEAAAAGDEAALRDAFQSFVGQTLFGEMLKAMRSTVPKGAYFHGGTAEEVFRGQLDQVLAERLAENSGEMLAGPMFELFSLRRQ